MPTLVSTPGAEGANTFASLEEYKAYIAVRRPQPTWAASAIAGTIDAELTIDLIAACRILNVSFDWTGVVSPLNLSESLLWPREGMLYRNGKLIPNNINPIDLKNAQCELAVQLHSSDLLSDNEVEKQGISRVKAGSVEVGFQNRDKSSEEGIDAAIRRAAAKYNYLSDSVPRAVRLLLVPSWYREAGGLEEINSPFMFEVM